MYSLKQEVHRSSLVGSITAPLFQNNLHIDTW